MPTLDLCSDPFPEPSGLRSAEAVEPPPVDETNSRRYLGVRFNCCDVYIRIYVNRDGTAYEGRCPKCSRPVKVKIGQGGTSNRFFEAY